MNRFRVRLVCEKVDVRFDGLFSPFSKTKKKNYTKTSKQPRHGVAEVYG